MRILGIQQNIIHPSFTSHNVTSRPYKGVYDAKSITVPFKMPDSNEIKMPNRDRLGPYFDIKKLQSLEPSKAVVIEKPKSFEDSHAKFKMDNYQKWAVDAFNSGNTAIVTAPTGTGKTLIAEHCINALENGKKIIYLSPLKALSNEKYTDFSKLFGEYDEEGNLVNTDNVGLLTGDNTINPNAPILVMTTEIYRNSLLAADEEGADEKYKDYDAVIYDEFHYLGDKSRGNVWEEAVMFTPSHMKQLMLSATASNADKIAEWVQTINPEIETTLIDVPESERHVPLREFILTKGENNELDLTRTQNKKLDLYRIENEINLSDRQYEVLEELKEIIGAENEDDVMNLLKKIRNKNNSAKQEYFSNYLQQEYNVKPDKAEAISLILSNKNSTIYKKDIEGLAGNEHLSKVVKMLNEKEMTPALIYIFSKKGCNRELEQVALHSESLLTPEQSKEVYDEVQKCKEKGVFLGSDFNDFELEALMKGFAVHHAGRLPAYKSLIENLSRKGLVKACFATETLLAGINMPFKTTVFTSLEKYDEEEFTPISTQIFKQGAGRAGRRGKDDIGNVIVMASNMDQYQTYVQLSNSRDTSIQSQYSPSYASILSDRMLKDKEDAILRSFAANESPRRLEDAENYINSKLEILKQLDYVEENIDGSFVRTEKGEFAKQIYGINELFLTELLFNSDDYLQGCNSDDLIALATSLSDEKDAEPSREFKGNLRYLQSPMDIIFDLMDYIDNVEMYYGLRNDKTPISTNLVPYVLEFANAPFEREEAINSWCEIMNKMREKEVISHEGDFLRVINSAIDILKMIYELSPDNHVRWQAEAAIDSLRKPPVDDIFNYELAAN